MLELVEGPGLDDPIAQRPIPVVGTMSALRKFERAIELRPSYADPHVWLAWVQLLLGRPEKALEAAARALDLDPLAP